jgi:hypothetical protein
MGDRPRRGMVKPDGGMRYLRFRGSNYPAGGICGVVGRKVRTRPHLAGSVLSIYSFRVPGRQSWES